MNSAGSRKLHVLQVFSSPQCMQRIQIVLCICTACRRVFLRILLDETHPGMQTVQRVHSCELSVLIKGGQVPRRQFHCLSSIESFPIRLQATRINERTCLNEFHRGAFRDWDVLCWDRFEWHILKKEYKQKFLFGARSMLWKRTRRVCDLSIWKSSGLGGSARKMQV